MPDTTEHPVIGTESATKWWACKNTLISRKPKPAIPETVSEPDPDVPAVSEVGDLWSLGRHRLLCGDARDLKSQGDNDADEQD